METFQVIPAVDILGGRGVRLYQGDYDQATDYGDPVELARQWYAEGARWLHVVDLDGARQGSPAALDLVQKIRRETGAQIQLGGGIRSAQVLRTALEYVDRVILSSWALREPGTVQDLCRELPGRIIISLDIRDGHAWGDGWKTRLPGDPADLARQFTHAGAAGVIVTSIEGDGTLSGVSAASVEQVAAWGVPFWWAGGIAAASDVATIRRSGGPFVRGAIIGRALYAGTVTLAGAIQAAKEAVR